MLSLKGFSKLGVSALPSSLKVVKLMQPKDSQQEPAKSPLRPPAGPQTFGCVLFGDYPLQLGLKGHQKDSRPKWVVRIPNFATTPQPTPI